MSGTTIAAFLILLGAVLVYWSLTQFGIIREELA